MSTRYWVSTSSTDWAVTTNWSDSSGASGLPAAGDDIYITANSVSIDTNLDQHTLNLNSLTIDQNYTGKIGTASTYLKLGTVTTLNVGRQPGDQTATGSARLHLSGTFTTVNVIDTCSSSADVGFPPVCLLGTITTLNQRSGRVGVGALTPVETATVTTANVTQSDAASSSPVLLCGPGVTLTNCNVEAGRLVHKGSATVTAATIVGGEYRIEGSAAHTTLKVESGRAVYNGTGTVTNLSVYNAQVDFSNDPRSKTVSICDLYRGANLNLATGVANSVTLTNGMVLHGCDLGDVTVRVGTDRTLSVA